ncbi:unnamed protein product [Rhizophagus irregularis]|nr:unnamed protein product [Rhizophagus irregularis]
MTAVLRSTNFLTFKIPDNKKAHSYFKNVEARYWQLKHYLGFRLKSDEIILPWNTVYDDWRQTLVYIFKDYYKIVPSSVSAFCKDLYYICDTFEGTVVRENCEKFYNEFYQLNLDQQIAERIRQIDCTVFSSGAESSSGKRARHFAPESELKKISGQDHEEYEDENKLNLSNEESDLCNNQEESIDEYDAEAIRNLLNESETRSQEMNTILSNFRTYQHETRNILSENGIMDLKEIFEPIDKMFPEEAHEFLTISFQRN